MFKYIENNRTAHIVVLVILVCVAYANALHNGFVWDDEDLILGSPFIRDWSNLPFVFTNDLFAANPIAPRSHYYRPLVTLSYMADYAVWGLKPLGFHLTNILLHALNSVLAYLVACRLFPGRALAFAFALLFALHPIHTESVTWISGRTDLIAAMFILLSLLFYMRIPDHGSIAVNYAVSLCFFVAGLLSKELVLVAPCVLLAYDYFFRDVRKRALLLAPFFAIAVVYFIARMWLLDVGAAAYPASKALVLVTSFKALAVYVFKLLVPIHLNAYYMLELSTSLMDIAAIGALLALCALLVCIVRYGDKFVWFAALFFFITIMPVSNLVSMGPVEESYFNMAERFLYVPSLGFCLLLAVMFKGAATAGFVPEKFSGKVLIAVVISVSAFYAVRIVYRNADWKDSRTLYVNALEDAPNSYKMRFNLGQEYYKSREFDKALAEYSEVLRLRPKLQGLHNSIGIIYLDMNDFERAFEEFNAAYELNPGDPAVRYNFGYLYLRIGEFDKAIGEYEAVLKANPYSAEAHNNMGFALENKGFKDEACESMR